MREKLAKVNDIKLNRGIIEYVRVKLMLSY